MQLQSSLTSFQRKLNSSKNRELERKGVQFSLILFFMINGGILLLSVLCKLTIMSSKCVLNLEERINVIKDSCLGISQRKLAEKYNCGKTQILKILKNKDVLQKEWESNTQKCFKRKRRETYVELNNLVLDWFQKASVKQLPISGPILQKKAQDFAEKLGISSFRASNGWLESFRSRNNIVYRKVCGESGSVDIKTTEDWKERLPTKIEGYELSNIFNIDEAGLFFRALPDKTLIEKGKKCSGGKMAKERLTVLFCCSATGEKEKPLVVSKSKNPRCMKGVDKSTLGVHYYANNKAWMNSEIFTSWLWQFNEKMKRQKRHILLFLDNAPCHPDGSYSNIKLCFFPPNTTSVLQPLDQGIIQTFKLQYRKLFMKRLIASMDECQSASELTKKINVYDAIRLIKRAWDYVNKETIEKCFLKSGFPATETDDDDDTIILEDESDKLEDVELQDLCHALKITEFTSEDINCCHTFGNNWEEEIFQNSSPLETRNMNLSESDEDDADDVEIMPFKDSEAVDAIARLRAIFTNQNNGGNYERIMNHLQNIEDEVIHISLRNKIKSRRQTTLHEYFK